MKEKRIGKFVTREYVTFTKSEIGKIVSFIEGQFKGNEYGIEVKSCNADNEGYLKSLEITLSAPFRSGRDSGGARFEFKGVSFLLHKAKGVLEIDYKNGIYEPFDGVCYSGSMLVHGRWCRYRGRTWETYQKGSHYRYGDEICDLDFTEAIKRLYNDLRYCREC